MSILLARAITVLLAILPPAGAWLAVTARKRLGWISIAAKVAWLVMGFPLGVGTVFLQVWLYRWFTGSNPMNDIFFGVVVVIEELLFLGLLFFYLFKQESEQKNLKNWN